MYKQIFGELIEDFEIDIIEQNTVPSLQKLMMLVVNTAEAMDRCYVDNCNMLIQTQAFPRFRYKFKAKGNMGSQGNCPYDLMVVFMKNGCYPMGLKILLENCSPEEFIITRNLILSSGGDAIDFLEFFNSKSLDRIVSTLPHACVDYVPPFDISYVEELSDLDH